MKTAYEYLTEMSKIRNEKNSLYPSENPITNRVQYIIDSLKKLNVEPTIDKFKIKGFDGGRFVNLVVIFNTNDYKITETIAIIAHHDVNNVNSENCQDNTASICHLLSLCGYLKNLSNKKELKKNVIICFTDREEFGGQGAGRFSSYLRRNVDEYDVKYVLNLELTGLGKNIFADGLLPKKTILHLFLEDTAIKMDKTITYLSTPFNDSYILRGCCLDSVCIGTLPDDEINPESNKKTWKLCHGEQDTLDKCSEEDMIEFTDFLKNLI